VDSLGESVHEEVEEQLEALLGVVAGEVVGEVHEVREALGREGGDVVAGHDGGLVWRGLVGWWLAAFAGLVSELKRSIRSRSRHRREQRGGEALGPAVT
jgi:hypothetical protein